MISRVARFVVRVVLTLPALASLILAAFCTLVMGCVVIERKVLPWLGGKSTRALVDNPEVEFALHDLPRVAILLPYLLWGGTLSEDA